MTTEWIQSRIAKYANPDYAEVIGSNGAIWERTHPMKCPHCGCIFFGFQMRDFPFAPYHNPDPRIGHGRRQVCGHPGCFDAEIQHQREREGHYQKARTSFYTVPEPETAAKKAGNLKRFS